MSFWKNISRGKKNKNKKARQTNLFLFSIMITLNKYATALWNDFDSRNESKSTD